MDKNNEYYEKFIDELKKIRKREIKENRIQLSNENGYEFSETNLYNRAKYLYDNLNKNTHSIMYLLKEKLPVSKFAEICFNFFICNTNSNGKKQWLDKLSNSDSHYEVKLRDYLHSEFPTNFDSLCAYANLLKKEYYETNQEYYLRSLSFLLFYDNGLLNPLRRKSKIRFNNHLINIFDNSCNIADYMKTKKITYNLSIFCELTKYIRSNPIPPELYSTVYDAVLGVFTKATDEIEFLISLYFDTNFYFFYKNPSYMNEILCKLTTLNKNMNTYIESNRSFTFDEEGDNIADIVIFSEFHLSKKSFNSIFSKYTQKLVFKSIEHPTLTSKSEFLNTKFTFEYEYSNYPFDRYSNNLEELKNKCEESKEIRTFKNTCKIIKEFDEHYHLANPEPIDCRVPIIGLQINLKNDLDFEIFYKEFYVYKDDLKENNSHDEYNRISTRNIIKEIQSTLLKNEDENAKGNNYYFNEKEDLIRNQLIHSHSVLLTEKMRRGYYKKFNLSSQYNALIKYKSELQNTVLKLYELDDLQIACSLTSDFYDEISILMNEFSKNHNRED